MSTALDSLRSVRITREDVQRCTEQHQAGPEKGCPMCFLRAEYTILEIFKADPQAVLQALERSSGRIKEQILRQEQQS